MGGALSSPRCAKLAARAGLEFAAESRDLLLGEASEKVVREPPGVGPADKQVTHVRVERRLESVAQGHLRALLR